MLLRSMIGTTLLLAALFVASTIGGGHPRDAFTRLEPRAPTHGYLNHAKDTHFISTYLQDRSSQPSDSLYHGSRYLNNNTKR
jgi:hypothetical protein